MLPINRVASRGGPLSKEERIRAGEISARNSIGNVAEGGEAPPVPETVTMAQSLPKPELYNKFVIPGQEGIIQAPPPIDRSHQDILNEINQARGGASGLDLVKEMPLARTEADLSLLYGSPYTQMQQEEPVLDAQGRVVPGQTMMTGLPEQQNRQIVEEQSVRNIDRALNLVAANPTLNSKAAYEAALREKARQGEAIPWQKREKILNDDTDIELEANARSTAVNQVIKYTAMDLFHPDVSMKINENGTDMTAGLAILADEPNVDITNPAVHNLYSTIFGVAINKAIAQTERASSDPDASGDVPTDTEGRVIDSATYFGNAIGATSAFAKRALKAAGQDISPDAVEKLAKATVLGRVFAGDLEYYKDARGRGVLVPSKRAKKLSKEIAEFEEAIMGELVRPRSSSSPLSGGNTMVQGRPNMTRRSVGIPGLVTTTADATKHIMGRIATVFRDSDIRFVEKSLELVLSMARTDQGKFLYSNHPMAKRMGLSFDDYQVARDNVKEDERIKTLPADSPERANLMAEHTRKQDSQAAEVMNRKLQMLKWDIMNARESPGLRYTPYSHALNNHRFYPGAFDTDYMGRKVSIRDMMGLAKQDIVRPEDLFNVDRVREIKNKLGSIFLRNKPGQELHDALNRLTPEERGALGVMYNAVVNYETIFNKNKRILKMPPQDVLVLYTPEIGKQIADLGRMYNQEFLEAEKPSDTAIAFLASMEKGEALANKNLWDDMWRVYQDSKIPAKARISIPLTHHSIDDGNQNGIFLQSIFFGVAQVAEKLGVFNPDAEDFRTHSYNTLVKHMNDSVLTDADPSLAQAWNQFFEKINGTDKSKAARLLMKYPLMQHAYGKDASMFYDLLYTTIDQEPDLKQAMVNVIPMYKGGFEDAVGDLASAMELALKESIDSDGVRMMKAIGRYMALLNTPIVIPGVTGDTAIISPVDNNYVNDNVPAKFNITMGDNGFKYIMRKPSYMADTFTTPDGNQVALPSTQLSIDPNYAKPNQRFWNYKRKQWDVFHNVAGTSQARNMAVLPIQMIDGDLVGFTTLFVNNKLMAQRKAPEPILWVHDSMITTPGSAFLYRNAYNNIAIPKAIAHIKKYGRILERAVREAERQTIQRVKAKGEPVGIGDFGEFPSLGAYFDEWAMRAESDSYKIKFEASQVKRKHKQSWEEHVRDVNNMLGAAKAAGWVPPTTALENGDRREMAVTPNQFEKLVNIAGNFLKVTGPQDTLTDFSRKFEGGVEQVRRHLISATNDARGGIAQMTGAGAGNAPMDVKPYYERNEQELAKQAKLREEELQRQREREATEAAKREKQREDAYSKALAKQQYVDQQWADIENQDWDSLNPDKPPF